jgi:hypothetical protein
MRRIVVTCLVVLLLGGLIPGVSEFVENVVHLATQGHLAHAAADGDTHGPVDAEHGCAGVLHVCSCCASVSCLVAQSALIAPGLSLPPSTETDDVRIGTLPSSGLDHPPKA